MAVWEAKPPKLYNIVTGFFPETNPKEAWKTDPRPLLVCGLAQDPETKVYFCRVAYGTTKKISKARDGDLVVGNMSSLNSLGLKHPTRFVTHSGEQMAILPWLEGYFKPWNGYGSPVLSMVPEDMQRFLGNHLGRLTNLPKF